MRFFNPSAVAFHVRGGTSRISQGIDKPYARRYIRDELHLDLVKNRYLSLIKNESLLGFILHLPFILAYEAFVWGYILFVRRRLAATSLPNLKYIKNALAKRGLITKKMREKHRI